jgi:hypothetical protein
MALYFLQCELRSSRSYEDLYEHLDRLNAVQVYGSLWCFHQAHTGAAGLREVFKSFVHPGDRLVVIEAHNWAIANAVNAPHGLCPTHDAVRAQETSLFGASIAERVLVK